MVHPSGAGLALFLAVVGFCLVCWVAAVVATAPSTDRVRQGAVAAGVSVAWVAITSIPTGAGLITPENALPGAPLLMGTMFLVSVGVVGSPLGRRIAHGLPLWALVGVQGMRFPLELVLHRWAEEGVAPPQMTWTGQNVDIVAGLVCLALAPFADRSRAAAWASQVVGIALLANVLRVVVLSLPTPLRSFEVPLMLPFSLPAVWIATVCVATAVMAHGLVLRRLLGAADPTTAG
ncbi:MAG: hypothetical protein R3F61_37070 [Myxococcota bacterium]